MHIYYTHTHIKMTLFICVYVCTVENIKWKNRIFICFFGNNYEKGGVKFIILKETLKIKNKKEEYKVILK